MTWLVCNVSLKVMRKLSYFISQSKICRPIYVLNMKKLAGKSKRRKEENVFWRWRFMVLRVKEKEKKLMRGTVRSFTWIYLQNIENNHMYSTQKMKKQDLYVGELCFNNKNKASKEEPSDKVINRLGNLAWRA